VRAAYGSAGSHSRSKNISSFGKTESIESVQSRIMNNVNTTLWNAAVESK